jgi:hypothetical protein
MGRVESKGRLCGNSPVSFSSLCGKRSQPTNVALPVFVKVGSARSLRSHIVMSLKLSSLALITATFLMPTAARAQSVARVKLGEAESLITTPRTEDQILTTRAIAALKRLDRDVLVYRSLGDFEESGKLARVSFEVFKNDLREVTEEVEPLLSRLPQSRLKTEISNALDSYRDGAFWWQKIDQRRVVHVSALAFAENTRTPSDAVFLSTVPYTVAMHWRQAGRYLKRAEELMTREKDHER